MVSVVAVFYSLLLCCIILEGGGGACVDAGLAGAAAPGDITIAGIFPIHGAVAKQDIFSPQPQRCIRLDETGLTRALVMISAVEAINESPVLNDIGVTLGYQIYDSCADVSMALRATADFTQPADCSGGRNACVCDQPVMVVVGASHSETSIAVARQLTLKKIPQISYSSTAVTLSDKTRFPTFMRTVPNDDYQTAAMVRLLGDYGWNWVGIITTDGDYGLSALNSFVSQASENGICVAFKSILPVSLTSQDLNSALRETVKTISNNPKVNVIVSFSKASHMKHLFQSLREEALGSGQTTESARRVWVASDSWSSSNSVQGQLKLEDIGHIVGFTFKNGDLSSFRRYLSRLEDASLDSIRNNSFLQEFYMQLNASGDTGGTVLLSEALKILQKYTHADTTLSIEMAVSAIAQAVASICSRKDCKTPGMVQPLEVLKALLTHKFQLGEKVYKFDSNGDINLGYDMNLWRSENGILHVDDVVAEYHPKNNSFTYTNHNTTKQLHSLRHIVSRCSNSCVPGEFKKTVEGQHTCCYECINCTENYYSNATGKMSSTHTRQPAVTFTPDWPLWTFSD
ncbi:hypothetical protein LDENG_00181820 [Lucifuga dentata]|nr:hypothetical protein LDENG_00181820 [Lucifuga dentata]